MWTVLSGGSSRETISRSEKPATETSSSTRRPSRWHSRSAPRFAGARRPPGHWCARSKRPAGAVHSCRRRRFGGRRPSLRWVARSGAAAAPWRTHRQFLHQRPGPAARDLRRLRGRQGRCRSGDTSSRQRAARSLHHRQRRRSWPTETHLFLNVKCWSSSNASRMNPLERLGTPEDIAAAVAFLVGPDGAWING
jgi:hypothetical protein